MAAPDDVTVCRDCGNTIDAMPDEQLERLGWVYLPVSRRWRCPNCVHALAVVGFADERPSEDA